MSNIKKHFKSRWKEKGTLIEADYSQLEIYVLAHLSGDINLKNDLLSGKDLHAISAENLFGPRFTKEQRKIAKQLSFQLQYGAGAKSMAEKNNISVYKAKQFIVQYYRRYPDVENYQEYLIQLVRKSRIVPPGARTEKGFPQGVGSYQQDTGRLFTFVEEDSPEWIKHTETSFRPTQIKNYGIQGFAGGDIVLTSLGVLHRELKQNEKLKDNCLLINTIHDSVMADCKDGYVSDAVELITDTMEAAPQYLKEWYDIDFDLPLQVEVKTGKNWGEMIDYPPF